MSKRKSQSAPAVTIEHYARCTQTVHGYVIEPGLELRDGDDLDALIVELEAFARWVGAELYAQPARERLDVCRGAADESERRWPGRAFFVEMHDAEFGRWSQTFQPYGLPRAR